MIVASELTWQPHKHGFGGKCHAPFSYLGGRALCPSRDVCATHNAATVL